jgi:dihydrofolate reductase
VLPGTAAVVAAKAVHDRRQLPYALYAAGRAARGQKFSHLINDDRNETIAPSAVAGAKALPAMTHHVSGGEPSLAFIAAIAANGAIGRNNATPWHLPSDLRHFRALTLGKPVLMGRKTYESIGRPLPGRTSIVVTGRRNFAVPADVHVAPDPDAALVLATRLARDLDAAEIMVAGGAQLFAALADRAERLYLTFVDLTPPADTFFPAIDWSCWREVRRLRKPPGKGDDAAFSFADFERRRSTDADSPFLAG